MKRFNLYAVAALPSVALASVWVCAGLASGGCAPGSATQCTIAADCASGMCLSNGTCAAPASSTTPDSGAVVADSGPHPTQGSDAGVDAPVGDSHVRTPPPDDGVDAGGCMANDSGMISREQLFYEPGLHATFRVADNVTVNTAGTTLTDGTRTWDYSGALQGDQDVIVQTLPLTGAWYASSFPGSGYASPLSNSEPLLGVFSVGNTALVLNGIVSETMGTTQTNLNYNPPATTLAFPIAMGATWQSTSTVTGTAGGIPSTYTEEYQSKVDASGTLKVPFGTFPVLRVVTLLTRTLGIYVTYTETFQFMTPCFGTIASITSQTSQADLGMGEFTSVAEIERLAP